MNRYENLISGIQPEYLFFDWMVMTHSPEASAPNQYGCNIGNCHLGVIYQMHTWNGLARDYTTGEVRQDFGKADEWWEMRDELEKYYREKLYKISTYSQS